VTFSRNKTTASKYFYLTLRYCFLSGVIVIDGILLVTQGHIKAVVQQPRLSF